MSIIQGSAKQGATRGFYPVSIDHSLRFNDDDSAYLSRTPAEAGDQKTWTFSCWFKIGSLTTTGILFSAGINTDNRVLVQVNSNDELQLFIENSGTFYQLRTSSLYRDHSSWYHVVVYADTTEVTPSDRLYMAVNGQQITAFEAETYPTLNLDTYVNRTNAHSIGSAAYDLGALPFDGYLAEVHFTDGTAYDADAFGELKSGVWVAKAPSVDYGTNGFYLDFATSGDGTTEDISGNDPANDWDENNITASDVVLDSPTDNYATLNPLLRNATLSPVLSDGNLAITASSSAWMNGASTIGMSSGQWYFEVTPTVKPSTPNYYMIGLCEGTQLSSISYTGSSTNSWGYFGDTGVLYNNGGTSSFGATYTLGDTIGVAFDADAGTLEFFKNNVSQGTVSSISSGEYFFCSGVFAVNYQSSANFGQLGFTYTPPTGYLALSTANLPEPTISPADDASPEDYFGTLLYSGNNATDRLIATGEDGVTGDISFTPDFVWIKSRNTTSNHTLQDVVRGSTKTLFSDGNFEEEDYGTNGVDSFETDGFIVSHSATNNLFNVSGRTYVAWNWKANGSGVSNTEGDITSTVSANTTSGFSIVTYTGNGTDNQTVGHGLDQTPEFIMIKKRVNNAGASTGSWIGQHIGLTTPPEADADTFTLSSYTNGAIYLDVTNAESSYGFDHQVNGNTDTFVAYCFHSVEGFSKFGTYDDAVTGSDYENTSPFVYTGFRPAFVMIKGTSSGREWVMYDDKRTPDNGVYLRANTSAAEQTDATNHDISFNANGFKIRGGSGDINTTNESYIYMAFADQPFKYANGGTE